MNKKYKVQLKLAYAYEYDADDKISSMQEAIETAKREAADYFFTCEETFDVVLCEEVNDNETEESNK